MWNKKRTKIELSNPKRVYEGRLLGLMTDRETHALVSKRELQKKILSGQTVPLGEIAANYQGAEELNGLRLVMAVKEIDGKAIGDKHLFISGKLDYIKGQNASGSKVFILDKSNELYTITEENA